jgi:hypothetical protein
MSFPISTLLKHCSAVAILLASNMGCSTLPPEPVRAVTAVYAPVIDALGRYQAAKGAYPHTLEALAPDFIRVLPPSRAEVPSVGYFSDGQTYHLEFSYAHGGMNTCMYWSSAKRWNCTGYL